MDSPNGEILIVYVGNTFCCYGSNTCSCRGGSYGVRGNKITIFKDMSAVLDATSWNITPGACQADDPSTTSQTDVGTVT